MVSFPDQQAFSPISLTFPVTESLCCLAAVRVLNSEVLLGGPPPSLCSQRRPAASSEATSALLGEVWLAPVATETGEFRRSAYCAGGGFAVVGLGECETVGVRANGSESGDGWSSPLLW